VSPAQQSVFLHQHYYQSTGFSSSYKDLRQLTKYSNIGPNTTWIIQVTSPELVAEISNTPIYLFRGENVNYDPTLAVEVMFNDGFLFTLNPVWELGCFSISDISSQAVVQLSKLTGIYSGVGRTFSMSGNPPQLVWSNYDFENGDVIFEFDVVDGLVRSYFNDSSMGSNSEVVTLLVVPPVTSSVPSSTQAPVVAPTS
jgi:hypothetical protein